MGEEDVGAPLATITTSIGVSTCLPSCIVKQLVVVVVL